MEFLNVKRPGKQFNLFGSSCQDFWVKFETDGDLLEMSLGLLCCLKLENVSIFHSGKETSFTCRRTGRTSPCFDLSGSFHDHDFGGIGSILV